MKKLLLPLMAVVAFTACTEYVEDKKPSDGTHAKDITINVQGDFMFSPMTRSSLTADGKDMTDLWVFDYQANELKQQLHQTSEDEDFGEPTLTLGYGTHHLYFVASRGQSPTVDLVDNIVAFSKVLDTFWADYTIAVSSITASTADVELDRVVTKLAIAPTDVIPTGTAKVEITPHLWYYGVNYMTGEPALPSDDEPITMNIPSSIIGTTISFIIYGFSSATQWTTNVTVESFNGSNESTSSVTIANAPMKRNRITQYSGQMWSSGTTMSVSLSDEWGTAYSGTW